MKRNRQINFRCPEEIAELFEGSAKSAGVSLTTWLILLGLEASGHGELRRQFERLEQHPVRKKKAAKR